MCSPASFVLTKDRVFWSKKSDSHEDIIEEFGLSPDGVRGPNIVRVEITPPEGDMRKPLKEWSYRVDQDKLPPWHDAKETEKRTRAELKEWFKERVILDGEREIKDGNVFAYGGFATLYGNATATLYGNATATLYGNATATLWDNAAAKLWDNATATLCGNATATPTGPKAVAIDRKGPKAICTVGE